MHVMCQIVFALGIVAMTIASPSSYANHCGKECRKNICALTLCEAMAESRCKGKIRQGGGFCNCCENCIIPLRSACDPNPGHGIPEPVPYCDEGLTCDCRTKQCVPCGRCAFPFQ